MNVHTVVTESSVWTFDLDRKKYLRLPKNESPPDYVNIAYDGEWDDFVDLCRESNERIMVVRPKPFGEGQLRRTGIVLSGADSLFAAYVELEPDP